MKKPLSRSSVLWLIGAILLAALAAIAGVVSLIAPRFGNPLVFVFTMAAVVTYTMGSWDSAATNRPRLVLANVGALVTQMAILYLGLAQANA